MSLPCRRLRVAVARLWRATDSQAKSVIYDTANDFQSASFLTELTFFAGYVITRHSLVERRARYLVYCMFVRSTISQQPACRFTPYFACWRSLGRDVSSPLLGVGGPRRAEKEANEIFVTMGVNGEFLHFGGF